MIYGYLRVSSDEQDVNSQKQGVEKFADEHGWKIDEYITDEGVSGGKDPSKRNLGPLLTKLQKGDILICSEISRLGRDLYMVMDILHHAMKTECIIYTVKDNFTLGNDIQSKVLAFAFGLAAEIERQMIQQRTKEGLKLRMKMGVLMGRGTGVTNANPLGNLSDKKEEVLKMYEWGVPIRRIAQNVGSDRNTIERWLVKWGVKDTAWAKTIIKERIPTLFDGEEEFYRPDNIDIEKIKTLIVQDLTIPQIADTMKEFSYGTVYNTIATDRTLNMLYRAHGQKIARKGKK